MNGHKVHREMPYPPYPEATFMYTSWTCLNCDWGSGTVMDIRDNPYLESARKAAEDHERKYDDR